MEGGDSMKKKFFTSLFAFLMVISVTTASYAATQNTYVTKNGIQSNATNWLWVNAGNDLHIKVTAIEGTASYSVYDVNGNFITSGTSTPSTPKAYSRGVPVGQYKLYLSCVGSAKCTANASLND
jgi:hypothetical protein